jgi:hypothetical protein
MKLLSEYINELTALLNEHGNIGVFGDRFGLRESSAQVAYIRINKSRESVPTFWCEYGGETWKGGKVIKIWC